MLTFNIDGHGMRSYCRSRLYLKAQLWQLKIQHDRTHPLDSARPCLGHLTHVVYTSCMNAKSTKQHRLIWQNKC